MDASRPLMPASYGVHDVPDGLLPWTWANDRLASARNYWLATASPGGRPHVAPIWGIWHDGGFHFGTEMASRKGRNLDATRHAVLHLESGDDVVIGEGPVTAASEASTVAAVVATYREKYGLGDDFTLDPCLVLRPTVVLGWREADFPTSATRWTSAP